jgi:D-alanine-D-alanine ligase
MELPAVHELAGGELLMIIGITYNLKTAGPVDPSLPDDFQEEFDSPHTIDAIARVLRELGHDVVKLGDGREFLERVLATPPDLVFNFAEGTGVSRSREARVPAVLEMLGIPYTGSDPLTMAVTLDKDCAKKLVAAAGVAVPAGVLLAPGQPLSSIRAEELRFPLIAKPAWEGSSKGIHTKSLVRTPAELPSIVDSLRRDHRQPVLLEEYIAGDELTVGMYGNDPPCVLAVMRVIPLTPDAGFIYSLEVKRNYKDRVRYECPALLSAKHQEAVERAALAAWHALGCRDIARVDFRLRDGVPYFLEVNPIDSDLVFMAKFVGWTYTQLIEAMVGSCLRRVGLQRT